MRPVGGLEAEFSLLVDGVRAKPEQLFGDPRGFIDLPLMHRTGRSFQLPNGAAVYFDTGVIEVATPVMELEQGCFGRLARSLDDAVTFVRHHLDRWEARAGRRIRLQGFSTHYNVSVARPRGRPRHRVESKSSRGCSCMFFPRRSCCSRPTGDRPALAYGRGRAALRSPRIFRPTPRGLRRPAR